MNRVEEFKKIVNDMAELYAKKNANYGNSFGETFEKLGPISGVTRLYDKVNRAISLVKGDENNFESLEDTFIDIACYAIMNIIEMRYQESLKNEIFDGPQRADWDDKYKGSRNDKWNSK